MSRLLNTARPRRLLSLGPNSPHKPRMAISFLQSTRSSNGLKIIGSKRSPFESVKSIISRRAYNTGYHYIAPTEKQNNLLIWGFIGVNVGVFAWGWYADEARKQGDPKPIIDFYNNMTLNLDNVMDRGRYWTVLTSCFTHTKGMHFFGNVLSFYFLARMVSHVPGFGPAAMATLVVGSGLTGAAGYLLDRHRKLHGYGDGKRGLGFSGAVMGVGAAAACLFPTSKVWIWGILPMPLWALMTGYAVYDGYYLQNDRPTGVAHAGHLGGAAFGVLFWFLKLRGLNVGNRPLHFG